MADFYTWNNENSSERRTILLFLSLAQDYTATHKEKLPQPVEHFNLAVGVLRAMLDRKPSELKS